MYQLKVGLFTHRSQIFIQEQRIFSQGLLRANIYPKVNICDPTVKKSIFPMLHT